MIKRNFLVLVSLIIGLTLSIHVVTVLPTPYDWDELFYTHVIKNTVEDGYPNVTFSKDSGEWFAYHPPFHFYLMSSWYQITGLNTVLGGRIYASIIAVAIVALSMRIIWKVTEKSEEAVLIGGLLLATDGWFNYTSLLVKIDSTSTLIGLVGSLFFIGAIQDQNKRWAVLSGLLVGFAAVYKHVGIIFPAAIVAHFLLTRFKNWQIEKWVFISIVAVIVLYVAGMVIIVGEPFTEATLVQIRRALGQQESRGLNFGIEEIINALVQTYWAFLGTISILTLAGLVVLKKAKDLLIFREDKDLAQIVALTLTAGVVLLSLQLRNPHYLVYLIPAASMLVGIQLARRLETRFKNGVLALLVIIVLLNGTTMVIRLTQFSLVNPLLEVHKFLNQQPADLVVLTEESICAEIVQECYKFGNFQTLERIESINPDLLVVYTTTTHQPPQTEALLDLIAKGEPLFRVEGWKEIITVLRVE